MVILMVRCSGRCKILKILVMMGVVGVLRGIIHLLIIIWGMIWCWDLSCSFLRLFLFRERIRSWHKFYNLFHSWIWHNQSMPSAWHQKTTSAFIPNYKNHTSTKNANTYNLTVAAHITPNTASTNSSTCPSPMPKN